jgi:hypothetical protein
MRPRWASLLVAFSLLASTGMAYAECAWVLWGPTPAEKYSGTVTAGNLTLFGAYETKDRCESERDRFDPGLSIDRPRGVVAASLVCLPDTVDPRGAKGR